MLGILFWGFLQVLNRTYKACQVPWTLNIEIKFNFSLLLCVLVGWEFFERFIGVDVCAWREILLVVWSSVLPCQGISIPFHDGFAWLLIFFHVRYMMGSLLKYKFDSLLKNFLRFFSYWISYVWFLNYLLEWESMFAILSFLH